MFNINAKELVALHNILYERFNARQHPTEEDSYCPDDVQLLQVYNRLRTCIIAALSSKNIDPVNVFLNREQAKIDKLKEQNEEVRQDQSQFVDSIRNDSSFFVPAAGESFDMPEYPRRAPRNRGGNKGNNKR